MAVPAIGANISYHNQAQLWEVFFRKCGIKPSGRTKHSPTGPRNTSQTDDGTTFPRQIGICSKYSATTAPTTNTAADAPRGFGDICVYFASNNAGLAHIDVANIDIYRCSAFTSATVFTWTKIVD